MFSFGSGRLIADTQFWFCGRIITDAQFWFWEDYCRCSVLILGEYKQWMFSQPEIAFCSKIESGL